MTYHHIAKGSILLLLCLLMANAQAQSADKFQPKKVRILFVLDGSGSMLDPWDGNERFEISKKLLLNMIDSLYKADPRVEIGVRVFGHQSPRSARDCEDTKLVIPFSKYPTDAVKSKLNALTPQGWTPIAFSMFRAAEDFPVEPGVQNAIVLITDGLETCDGDICAAGQLLTNKKISVRPFIIGLGLGSDKQNYFECLGEYYDASSAVEFKKILDLVVARSLNNTTTQLELMDHNNKPTQTDLPITLYDAHSGVLLYNFVHALGPNGRPDTLWLDPTGKYDITVHSFPPVTVKDVALKPGIHNIVRIPCASGTIKLTDNVPGNPLSPVQCLVLDKKTNRTLNLQLVNSTQEYLAGTYDLEILTVPRIIKHNTVLKGGQELSIYVPKPGSLQIVSGRAGVAGVYQLVKGQMQRVHEFGQLQPKNNLDLQPGEYILVLRWDDKKRSENTEQVKFKINSGATTTLRY